MSCFYIAETIGKSAGLSHWPCVPEVDQLVWSLLDSNQGPTDYESAALKPAELRDQLGFHLLTKRWNLAFRDLNINYVSPQGLEPRP